MWVEELLMKKPVRSYRWMFTEEDLIIVYRYKMGLDFHLNILLRKCEIE